MQNLHLHCHTQSPSPHPPSPKCHTPRSFLKRGEGIARFYMKPHPLKTKANTALSKNQTKPRTQTQNTSTLNKHSNPASLPKTLPNTSDANRLSERLNNGGARQCTTANPPLLTVSRSVDNGRQSERLCVRKVARGGEQYSSMESLSVMQVCFVCVCVRPKASII